jgi:anti-anti-sigma regulatory factor
MEMTSRQIQGRVPVTILQLDGKLDGSNYLQLFEEVKMIYAQGVRDLLFDLSRLTYLSSAGITAIHRTALVFRGLSIPNDESGWASYHAIDRDRDSGLQEHVKLLSPTPEVAHILDIVGFKSMFEIHTDLDTAIASFQ